MQRRDFLKGACKICLLGTAMSAVAADLSSCSPKSVTSPFRPPVNNNQVEVPLSMFETKPFLVVTPAKYLFEIAIEKKPDSTYKALLLKCTHQQNQLTITGNGYTCSMHGSKFDKEGSILKGPAEMPLQQLKTQVINNNLLIHL